MSKITLPTLYLYGGIDPIVPVGIGENGMEFISTPAEDKSLVILENSGHSLWEYESTLFFNEVRTFIAKYE